MGEGLCTIYVYIFIYIIETNDMLCAISGIYIALNPTKLCTSIQKKHKETMENIWKYCNQAFL